MRKKKDILVGIVGAQYIVLIFLRSLKHFKLFRCLGFVCFNFQVEVYSRTFGITNIGTLKH